MAGTDEVSTVLNNETEEDLVAAILLDSSQIARVRQIVKPRDFYSDEPRLIYMVASELYDDEQPIDLVTIRNELKRIGKLGTEEGKISPQKVMRLLARQVIPINAPAYAEEVKKASVSRALLLAGNQIEKIATGVFETEDKLKKAQDTVQEVIRQAGEQTHKFYLPHSDTLDAGRFFEFDSSDDPWEFSENRPILSFGFRGIDGSPAPEGELWEEPAKMLLNRSTLTCVLAKTSRGKTILLEQIAEHNAKHGATVFFFFNELSLSQMLMRRRCRLVGANFQMQMMWAQKFLKPTQADIAQLRKADEIARRWPGQIHYVHCPGWETRDIANFVRQKNDLLIATTGKGIDLVCYDYINRAGLPRFFQEKNTNEQLEYSLDALSVVANQLDIAVVYAAQTHRKGPNDDGRPHLEDGLGGGAIERFSQQVIAIYNEGKEAALIGRKSTFGERDWEIPVAHNGGRFEFVEI